MAVGFSASELNDDVVLFAIFYHTIGLFFVVIIVVCCRVMIIVVCPEVVHWCTHALVVKACGLGYFVEV